MIARQLSHQTDTLAPLTVAVADIIGCKGGVVAEIISAGGGVSDGDGSAGSSLVSESSDTLVFFVRRPLLSLTFVSSPR